AAGKTAVPSDGRFSFDVPAPSQGMLAIAIGRDVFLRAGSTPIARIERACEEAYTLRKWMELLSCATHLAAYDTVRAKHYETVARSENKAVIQLGNLEDAVKDKDLVLARKAFDAIPDSSVY